MIDNINTHNILDITIASAPKKLFTINCSIYIIAMFTSMPVSQSVIILIGIAKNDIIGLMILLIIYATPPTNIYTI